MINNPSGGVKFTHEQNEQISQLQAVLSNVQNEINIHRKENNSLKTEIEKLDKEKAYKEELVSNLTVHVDSLEATIKKTKKDVQENLNLLEETSAKTKELNKKSLKKESELTEREDSIKNSENELEKKVADFNTKSSQLSKDREEVKEIKSALLKVIEQVKW